MPATTVFSMDQHTTARQIECDYSSDSSSDSKADRDYLHYLFYEYHSDEDDGDTRTNAELFHEFTAEPKNSRYTSMGFNEHEATIMNTVYQVSQGAIAATIQQLQACQASLQHIKISTKQTSRTNKNIMQTNITYLNNELAKKINHFNAIKHTRKNR